MTIKKTAATPAVNNARTIKITYAASAVEKEPLLHPFGFKGGSLTELWQTVARLGSEGGHYATGLGVQSVLWSDPDVFSSRSEAEGNACMYAITQKALQLLKGQSFTEPVALLESLYEEVYPYARQVSGRQNLRKTFVLNALVPVDNAVWLLYARENGIGTIDQLLPTGYHPALSTRHEKLASIPVLSFGIPPATIKTLANQGHFFMKIKLGHPGTQQEMLEKDKDWLSQLHAAAAGMETPYTRNGKVLYYFDANGRYEQKETLQQFLEHARRIGALEQIALIEEPFPEKNETDVSGLGVLIAADESVHTDTDIRPRLQMGYRAIALKAVAKTMSMTLKIAKAAHEQSIPCFCADLTANPMLVEWNKNIAARLAPFPGLHTGLLETNGRQNYKNWDRLCSYSPSNNASWAKEQQGIFKLDEEYYRESGGIFRTSAHYDSLFKTT